MNKIKFFRQEKGMTVKELSEKSHTAVGYVSDLENDIEGVKNPTKDTMVRIAIALGRTVSEVFFPNELDKEVC